MELKGMVRPYDRFPKFNKKTSSPEYSKKDIIFTCNCFLCREKNIFLFDEVEKLTWQLITRLVFKALKEINVCEEYFDVKTDVHWFIYNHWYLFGKLKQFQCPPDKWKRYIEDTLCHSTIFEN